MEREAVCWSCCQDSERMTATTLDEAVEEYLDGLAVGPFETLTAALRKLSELTVTAYARKELSRDSVAEMALEDTLERLDETYADPENGDNPATEHMKTAARAFANAIVADYYVWLVEPIREEKVNALDWVRKYKPRWLRDDEA